MPKQPEDKKPFDLSHNPVDNVMWVEITKLEANDYNPNYVPAIELELLYKSIKSDGFTQPIVTFYDRERDKFVIVDGFHRYTICKRYPDILEGNHGLVPVVVIDKPLGDRIASTIRHNRARGKHVVEGMVDVVYHLLLEGWSDEKICNEIGMGAGELVRIKYISGYAKLYDKVDYSKAWEAAIRADSYEKVMAKNADKANTDK